MQGINLTRLLLATNVFNAKYGRVYRWRQTRLVLEMNTFSAVYVSAVYECV